MRQPRLEITSHVRKPKLIPGDPTTVYRWHLRSANGQIIATSHETFPTRSHARRAAKALLSVTARVSELGAEIHVV
jgi:uncharacterized protein YegP (UPF0339 family)